MLMLLLGKESELEEDQGENGNEIRERNGTESEREQQNTML